ncbi:MAG: hypothetical protein H7835_07995, partial [Magnetococcus sp. XQGC-1]
RATPPAGVRGKAPGGVRGKAPIKSRAQKNAQLQHFVGSAPKPPLGTEMVVKAGLTERMRLLASVTRIPSLA